MADFLASLNAFYEEFQGSIWAIFAMCVLCTIFFGLNVVLAAGAVVPVALAVLNFHLRG